MPLVIACGGCKRKLRIADSLVGKTLKCPGCARKMKVVAKATPGEKQTVGTSASSKAKPARAAAAHSPALKPATPAVKTATPPKPDPKAPTPRVTASAPPPLRSAIPPRNPGKPQGNSSNRMTLILAGAGLVLLVGLVWFLFFRGSSFASVSGTVTLDGEPLGNAKVDFVSDGDPKLAPLGEFTDENGKYTLQGHTSAGVPVGKYKVFISKLVGKQGSDAQGEEAEPADGDGRQRNVLPALYNDPERTPFRANVISGQNIHDFQLERKPGR
jgi:hypothetical protein